MRQKIAPEVLLMRNRLDIFAQLVPYFPQLTEGAMPPVPENIDAVLWKQGYEAMRENLAVCPELLPAYWNMRESMGACVLEIDYNQSGLPKGNLKYLEMLMWIIEQKNKEDMIADLQYILQKSEEDTDHYLTAKKRYNTCLAFGYAFIFIAFGIMGLAMLSCPLTAPLTVFLPWIISFSLSFFTGIVLGFVGAFGPGFMGSSFNNVSVIAKKGLEALGASTKPIFVESPQKQSLCFSLYSSVRTMFKRLQGQDHPQQEVSSEATASVV